MAHAVLPISVTVPFFPETMPSVAKRPYHHCGPGNFVYDEPSSNPIDEACRQHDIKYGQMGYKAYFQFNSADQEFINNLDALPESTSQIGRARFYSKVFKLKKKIAASSSKENTGNMVKRARVSRSRSARRGGGTAPPTPRGRQTVRTARGRSRSRSRTGSPIRVQVRRAMGMRRARRTYRRARSGSVGRGARPRNATNHLRNGVTAIREIGDVKRSANALYIGHSTYLPYQFQLCFFRAILKNLLIKANKLNPDWNGLCLRGENNDTILVKYKGNAEKDTTISEYVYNWNALIIGQEAAATALAIEFQNDSTQLQFIEFQYRPSGTNYGPVSYYVDNAYVDIYVKSTLTLQNRTIDEPNDDSVLNIDRVPLIGKRYHGNGSGTKYITMPQISLGVGQGATVPFGGDMFDGVIWVDPENCNRRGELIARTRIRGLDEPPPSRHFQGCRGAKPVNLEPGQMIKDTLYLKKKMKIQDFVNAAWTKPIVTADDETLAVTSNAFRQSKVGNWSFFGMEKKLMATSATDTNAVKLAYQVDTKCSLVILPKRNTYTTPAIDVGLIGPELTTIEE